MVKALLKKQFLELNRFYFQGRKAGKPRTQGMTILFIALMVFVAFSVAMAFFGMGEMFANALLPLGLDWLYFALMGLMAIFISTLCNSFQAFSSLYVAKDNELLLSLPIPPAKILFARMTGVYGMGLLYEAVVWLPATLVYWLKVPLTVQNVLLPIVLLLVVAFLVLVLTCVVGFIIAAVATRVKNKSVVSLLTGILLMLVYYFCYFRMNTFLTSVVANATQIGNSIQTYALPFYYMGRAASGDWLAMLWFVLIVAVLFAVTYWALSRSFIRIATTHSGGKKAEYHEKGFKQSSAKAALLRKEFRHFTQSPAYMLNCGLGIFFLLGIGVLAIVRMDDVGMLYATLAESAPPWATSFLPIAATAIVCFIGGMDQITAPSISLEGNNLWVLRSSPVLARDVLEAKQAMHLLLMGIPSLATIVVLAVLLRTTVLTAVGMAAFVLLFTCFSAKFGLLLGLKKPNFDWTNETVPIKQSAAVVIGLLCAFLVAVAFAVPYVFWHDGYPVELYFGIAVVLLGAVVFALERWLKTRGVAIFDEL